MSAPSGSLTDPRFHPTINDRRFDPTDPLIVAVIENDLTSIRSLYTLDRTTKFLVRAAELACSHNKPEILSWTFGPGQGLRLPTSSLNSPLVHAAFHGASIPIYSLLISHGFDLNDNWSEACGDALSSAIHDRDLVLAKFLLENGIDVNSGHGYGLEINIIEALNGECASNDMVRLMLDHGFKPQGTAAAIAAAEIGNLEALRWFVDAGADLEEEGIWWAACDMESIESEGTALYRACRAGKVESVKWLLERGANPRAVDQAGRSCEDVAVAGGFEDIVAMLREKMAEEKA